MMHHRLLKSLFGAVATVGACLPGQALACAACFGKSDSALAQGMNMGILTLLGVIGVVLSSVAGFFVFLAWKGARTAHASTDEREPITSLEHD